MAGFFGMFDYSKPGPGIKKDEPKKKGFVVFFEIYFRKFWKLIIANLLYVLVSIPVLTGGLANAGLAYITRNYAREKHAFIPSDFFDTIKKNWKQALPVGIINLVLTFLLMFDVYIVLFRNAFKGVLQGPLYYLFISALLFIILVFTFMKYYIYMMLITFKLSIKQLYKNSLIFALTGLWRNLLISLVLGVMYAFVLALLFKSPVIGITVIVLFYVFLFPAFRSYLIQFTIFPLIKKHMIDPYYKAHPGEDKQAKRELNIEYEADKVEQETIFEDTLPIKDEESNTTFPRQYSEQEMKQLHRKHRKKSDESDDDGTI